MMRKKKEERIFLADFFSLIHALVWSPKSLNSTHNYSELPILSYPLLHHLRHRPLLKKKSAGEDAFVVCAPSISQVPKHISLQSTDGGVSYEYLMSGTESLCDHHYDQCSRLASSSLGRLGDFISDEDLLFALVEWTPWDARHQGVQALSSHSHLHNEIEEYRKKEEEGEKEEEKRDNDIRRKRVD
jgi:hypothetical protein